MKKRIGLKSFFIIFVVVGAQFYPAFGKDHTIAELYNLYFIKFQNSRQFVVPSELVQSNGKWVLKNPQKHWKKANITVDIKNGFLELTYDDDPPGAQGRSIKVTCAVFIKTDKSVFFAINTTKTQMLPEPDLKVYSFRNGVWTNVTDAVMPRVGYRMFLDEKYNPGKLSSLKENDLTAGYIIDYVLPRYGTTIQAVIIPDYIDDLFVRGAGDEGVIDRAINDIKENLTYGKIELLWNMKSGKFETGKKAR